MSLWVVGGGGGGRVVVSKVAVNGWVVFLKFRVVVEPADVGWVLWLLILSSWHVRLVLLVVSRHRQQRSEHLERPNLDT